MGNFVGVLYVYVGVIETPLVRHYDGPGIMRVSHFWIGDECFYEFLQRPVVFPLLHIRYCDGIMLFGRSGIGDKADRPIVRFNSLSYTQL